MTVLANAGATVMSNGGDRVTVQGLRAPDVAELLTSQRIRLEELVTSRATLEEAYFRLTRTAGEHTTVALAPKAARGVTATLRSEWTKIRTQRGTLVALATMCVLMVGMTVFLASQTETDAVFGGDDDVVQLGLAGVVFAQIAVIVAGASFVTGEFATGMIRTTFTATPGRLQVLAAKAIVLGVMTFPPALVTSATAFVLTQPLLHDRGYVAPGYPPVSITDPGAARAVFGTAVLLTAYALIALGIGTTLRHSGATIATAIGLIFMPFLFLGAFPERISKRIEQFSRSPAWPCSRRPTACSARSTGVAGCRSARGLVSGSRSRGLSAPSHSATSSFAPATHDHASAG